MKTVSRSFFIILLLISPLFAASGQDKGVASLTILHVNDYHGHLQYFIDKTINETIPVSGAAYLAGLIEKERARNRGGTLLLSAGDMFQGVPLSNETRGSLVLQLMNSVRFDAMVLGNHEFDWGQDVLMELKQSAKFPFVSANIVQEDGSTFPGATSPYTLLKRGGLMVGIIGATTPETPYATKPGNTKGLVFKDPSEVISKLLPEVRSRGARLVIVLSHLGFDQDIALAKSVPGIDVIVGGHSHTVALAPYVQGKTIIVQAGSYGTYLGVLRLSVERHTGRIVKFTAKNELEPVYAASESPKNAEIAELVQKEQIKIKSKFSEVIGETTTDLLRQSREESNIGDLLADSMREASGADIAVQNGGGIRSDIPKGKVTLEDIYRVLPFDNTLVTMELTGAQILQLVEYSFENHARILQISGMRVEYDADAAPGKSRTQSYIGDTPIDPDRIYTIATNDFLAAGGDQTSVLKGGENIRYGDDLREVFSAYIKKHSPVKATPENRIRFVHR